MDQPHSLLDRTVANLRRMWRDAAGILPHRGSARLAPDLEEADAELVRERMRACLEARGGEVSARARAADLGAIYLALSPLGRRRFLEILARDFGLDRALLKETAARYVAGTDPKEAVRLEGELRSALTAPRRRLLTQFNALSQGVKFLVDLRAELLGFGKGGELDNDLACLDRDLRELLESWFDIGFLDLRRITWRSPAALLEKLIAYEAVHRIRSWTDLRNRLDADRRCYGFFHPRMPDEPLIFVQVALVRGLAARIQPLLDEQQPLGDPQAADTAIFYSITNAQEGLRGIGFGAFLLKQVVDDLAGELPHLKIFATLSPIPGFRRWLDALPAEAVAGMVGERDAELLAEFAEPGGADWRTLLKDESWPDSKPVADALHEPLLRLCAHYLLEAKRGSEPLDPVARFHLNNGAAIERLNWLGDISPKGLAESAGLMVNYRYRLEDIEANHEAYSTHGSIAAAESVRELAGTVEQSWRIPLLDRIFD
jgi:malonyl-CoA decarboxylase